jgi:hypothetical protein
MSDQNVAAKDYVLALLNEFLEEWPIAKGLKILVESGNMDDKMLDGLAQIFQSIVHDVASNQDKGKFSKGLEYLQKVRAMEEAAHEKNQAELDEILENI